MSLHDTAPYKTQLEPTGLELPLTEMEALIQENCRRFARDILRPAGEELDRLSPEEVIAPESRLWSVLTHAQELGLSALALTELEPLEAARIMRIATEELAWGDGGLAGMTLVSQMPVLYSLLAGNTEMAQYCDGKMGCWGITEPDHGSDMLDSEAANAGTEQYGRPNCVARIEGDKIIVNGQKAAWVSGATVAEVCALYCHIEEDGQTRPGISLIVPLDAKGVTRGKPLEKMGLRSLNQGELYFDNVEVPLNHMLAGPDNYHEHVYHTLTEANAHVGNIAVGVARAAYEHALAYAHERKQGGQPIIRHQSVKRRLFEMFRKLEAARALANRVIDYNAVAAKPAFQGSIASKTFCTQAAFEIASDALQIFGGNGLTTEYPMEKLLRDARASMIADGCNEVLCLKGGALLVNPELL
jgi:alkylation response protein AidB-like acyl-CoA dehydrogenase